MPRSMKGKVRTAPALDRSTTEMLGDTFSSVNAGATYILDSFPNIYRRTLLEIKGQFNPAELDFLMEMQREVKLDSALPGQRLIERINNAVMVLEWDKRFQIDTDNLSSKIENLSAFSKVALELWATAFWTNPKRNRQKWIDLLS
jgi:hypothetical protein